MKRLSIFIFICVIIAGYAFSDEKGYDIVKKNTKLLKANTEKVNLTMILMDKNGKQKTRKLLQYTEKHKNGTNTFLQFLEPADIAGTKFLTLGNDNGKDEQRLFLPELGKIRRIASSGKDSSFMGSDLSYYDMETHELDDFTYTFIKEEKYSNIDCWVVDSVPNDKDAPYSKMRLWIGKSDFFRYKLECYDKKKSSDLVKTIAIVELKIIKDIIKPAKMVVDSSAKKTKTLLIMDSIEINIELDKKIFTVDYLSQ